jgi:hypothetical protein
MDCAIGNQKLALLQFALEVGDFVSQSRDNTGSFGVAKRFTVGFTQPQGLQSKDNSEVATNGVSRIPLPFFQLKNKKMQAKLNKMDASLKAALAKLLTLMSDWTEGFDDDLRNSLFGCRLAEFFGETCCSKFELLDIFVEANSLLHKHFDYKNGRFVGYNTLTSYSYVIEYEGFQYRVNIIGTGRSWCDSAMSSIREAGGNQQHEWRIEKQYV